MAEDSVKKELWNIVKQHTPIPIIIGTIAYVIIVFAGLKVYETLISSEQLNKEYIQAITTKFVLGLVFLTVVSIVCGIFYLIFYIRREKKRTTSEKCLAKNISDTHSEGLINAHIVRQDAKSRDDKFIEINQNVKNTYWVLGISLTSIAEREVMLSDMAKNGTEIRICMMNPEVTVDNLCVRSIDNDTCKICKALSNDNTSNIQLDDLKKRIAEMKDGDDLLEIYHVLINVIHFNQYYHTAKNYPKIIKTSYDSLREIKQAIEKKNKNYIFGLRVSDSFMPMSLTISDANDDGGRMVVEFHLPFTEYKVLFDINRKENEELFKVFVDFYDTIWERANNVN